MPVPGTDTRLPATAALTVSFAAIYVRVRADDTVEVLPLDLGER